MKSLLLTLFDIAFRSRTSLPLLVSAGFMLLDLHLRYGNEIILAFWLFIS